MGEPKLADNGMLPLALEVLPLPGRGTGLLSISRAVRLAWGGFGSSSSERRANIAFAGLLVILAVGLNRMYLGVPFLSDVLGGYLAGPSWLIAGIPLAGFLRSRPV